MLKLRNAKCGVGAVQVVELCNGNAGGFCLFSKILIHNIPLLKQKDHFGPNVKRKIKIKHIRERFFKISGLSTTHFVQNHKKENS